MSYHVKFIEVGDEGRSRLEIYHNDKLVEKHLDGGEPEDNYFFRDWSWVTDALIAAYEFGKQDATMREAPDAKS